MAILLKGKTFTEIEQVTSPKLHDLVDNADFASGAVDNASVALNGAGALTVKTAGITPDKLSTGAPTWTNYGKLSSRLLESTNSNGDEGGDLTLAVGTGNTGVDNVKIDMKSRYLRFWQDDTNGDAEYKGAEIDLEEMGEIDGSGRMNRIVTSAIASVSLDKVHRIVTITQAAYDILIGAVSTDDNTLYIIT